MVDENSKQQENPQKVHGEGYKSVRLSIDRNCKWYADGVEITHRRTWILFSRSLTLDTEGQAVVIIGKERAEVDIEDAPFMVSRVDDYPGKSPSPSSFNLTLHDGTIEPLQADTLRVGENNFLYCKVREGKFEARFDRKSYYQLAQFIKGDEAGRFFLCLQDKRYFLKGI